MTTVAEPSTTTETAGTTSFVLPTPLSRIGADLMPYEILVSRRMATYRRGLIVVVATLLVLMALGYAFARHQTSNADGDLAAANAKVAGLTTKLNSFGGVLATQSETEAIRSQLAGVMGDDVSWSSMVDEVAAAAPSGLQVATVTAQTFDPSSDTTTTDGTVPLAPDQATIGTLVLTGVAPNWRSVAAYVHNLSAIKGFTAVNPSTVVNAAGPAAGTAGRGLNFTVDLDLTSDVLSGRYTDTTAAAPAASGTQSLINGTPHRSLGTSRYLIRLNAGSGHPAAQDPQESS